MAKLTARIDGVAYDLREADGTTASDLAYRWERFAKAGNPTWLMTDQRTRVWVNWGKVTSFEVSEANAD